MRRTGILLGLLLVGVLMAAAPVAAAEGQAPLWRYNAHNQELPFPRSKRAEFGLGLRHLLDRMRFLLCLGVGWLP